MQGGRLDLRHRAGSAVGKRWPLLSPDPSHGPLQSFDADTDAGALVAAIPPAWRGVAVNRLDLRDLPTPEPLQRALRAVDALEPGQALEVLTALPPVPLLEALDERGLRWRTEPLADGGAWVAILRPAA